MTPEANSGVPTPADDGRFAARDDFGPGPGIGKPPAPPPEPRPGVVFDSHCHLDMIDKPVSEVLLEASAAGVTRVITVGTDVQSARWAADCAAAFPDVYAAVAIHPNETAAAARNRDEVLAEIAKLAALPQVVAVGETGLDYYRDSAPAEVQRDWFRAQIDIAKQVGKPLVIHDREAHEDVLAILAADGPPEQVIFHCYSGDAELAARCAAAGYVLSFAGTVSFQNAAGLREAAALIPAELMLAETDAPFLAPSPNRGKTNAPAQVANTVRALAEARQMDVAKLCAVIEANGQRLLFGGSGGRPPGEQGGGSGGRPPGEHRP
jgi:TatD DNase family protein